MSTVTEEKLAILQQFSACDVSDALMKVEKVPKGAPAHGGFLADLGPLILSPSSTSSKTIAPISTVQFIPKAQPSLHIAQQDPERHGFPEATHWVDHTQRDTIVLLDQPEGQKCAVLGGIMAARMSVIGAKGVIVNGRVRDMAELKASGLPIWARGQSTVGTGAEAKPGARNVPISVSGVAVSPGDIAFCDPLEGVVVIPQNLLDDVLALMPKLVEADDRVKEDVLNGCTVFDAFKKHRGA
ncbi:hypothetical protein D8B26_001676 [Coccidioides posadasii str. Silveira]|nr:hypothetical protein CPC735_049220 [Coccidioides posadasii C735 delta SOWgp]EER23552.1 hypothetical protein CPC735_049220 [Coccidioides posadasii C735 delta SOWgp]KMM64959.1 DlpA domain-containing protein [Coccidioides posadasii RMSCC 3488]QVM06970.1 hypothetical protein D8B26_001676 [Coccidioides posadasii str. Silveira]|eukprot:XP_003065697.1 hypothetical protein CPC735_049220 [Coccidioides posadasii C735 delta SOWgp]